MAVDKIAACNAAKVVAKNQLKADFITGFDPSKTLYSNAARLKIVSYPTVKLWYDNDETFKNSIDARITIYRKELVCDIQDVCVQAAKGEFFTETTYRDSKGKIKQTATYQQQPSYKHAELILKAFDPDTYKPEITQNGMTININLLPAQTGQGQDIADYIDITDDPGKGIDLFA